jgi:hypothetical protein
MVMTDEQKRLVEEARATIARLERLRPRSETVTTDSSTRTEPGSWRRHVVTEEPKRHKRGLDTAPVDWAGVIDARIADLKVFVMDVIAQAFSATLEVERSAVMDALSKRDAAISKLERDIAQQAVTIARLEVRLLQAYADDDRTKVSDLPNPLRKGLN